jgi:hypothetical protein
MISTHTPKSADAGRSDKATIGRDDMRAYGREIASLYAECFRQPLSYLLVTNTRVHNAQDNANCDQKGYTRRSRTSVQITDDVVCVTRNAMRLHMALLR